MADTTSTTDITTSSADPNVVQLEPVILNAGGKQLAPNTLTNHVYDPTTGESVDTILERIKNTSSTVYFTRTLVLEANEDNQSVFNIKYPIENYDINLFPILVMIRNEEVTREKYIVNVNEGTDDQLILNNALIHPLHQGETVAIIFHYADTMYNGSIINAQTINNITIIDQEPTVTPPDNTIFFDFANSQIIYYKDGVKTKFKIGPINITRSSMTITDNIQELELNIPGYNTNDDILFIYENNTYIPLNDYYTIDQNLIMRKINNVMWQANMDEPITFDFVVYKNATGKTSVDNPTVSTNIVVPKGTIDKSKLTPELITYMNEVKAAADKIEAIQGAVGLKEARPINQIKNSDFSIHYDNGSPEDWSTDGLIKDDIGIPALKLDTDEYAYSSAIDISRWNSEYTRVSFSFTGNGTVHISAALDGKAKPIRRFSDTAFSPNVEFKSTDDFYWQDSGSLIIEPSSGALSIHFDCVYGNINITEVMVHPIYTIDEDMNYKYSKGVK